MPKDSIAIIPENGYHPEQKQSKKALIWMKEIAEKEISIFAKKVM